MLIFVVLWIVVAVAASLVLGRLFAVGKGRALRTPERVTKPQVGTSAGPTVTGRSANVRTAAAGAGVSSGSGLGAVTGVQVPPKTSRQS